MVKRLCRLLEGHRSGVACDAGQPERATMAVLMAGLAGRTERQERPGLVTFFALGLDSGVATVESHAGLLEVIEITDIERPDLPVAPGVLHMAHYAVIRDLPMHTFFCGDPLGNRLMALEASLRRDPLAGLVAFFAVLQALEFCVRVAQWSRGQQSTDVLCRR